MSRRAAEGVAALDPRCPALSLDALPIPAGVASADGRLLYANVRLREAVGLDERAILRPGALLAAVHRDDRERVRRAMRRLVRRRPVEEEYRLWIRGASGEREARWHRGRAIPIGDDHAHFLCTALDIHDERRADEARIEERRWMDVIGEAMPDVLYLYHLAEGRNLYCNAAAESVLGYTVAEVQAMGPELLARVLHPDDWPRVRDAMAAAAESGEPGVSESEYRCIRPDGSVVWLNNRSLPVAFDAEGRALVNLGIARDVTAEKVADAAAAEHVGILENALEGIARIEPDQTISYANAAFAALFGREARDVIGGTCGGLLPAGDRARLRDLKPRAKRHGKASAEIHGLRADGSLFDLHATIVPREDGGLYLFLRDESERALFQGQLEDQLVAISQMRLELEVRAAELVQANAFLSREASLDGLTGLANHRAFQERLAALDAAETPYALLLLDVDHFKAYNDAFGHPAGDTVLRLFAAELARLTGEDELAARYGGEEFALVLPELDVAAAEARAGMILRRLTEAPWPHRPISASIGCAASHGSERRVRADVIEAADRALYRSKREGRARVTAAAA